MYKYKGRFRMEMITSQVLCEELKSPNGFIPSVLNVNLTFWCSLPKSRYFSSIFLHWEPSTGCRSFPSFLLRLLKCQVIISSSLGFRNKRRNREITRRCHMTIVRILLFFVALEELPLNSSTP